MSTGIMVIISTMVMNLFWVMYMVAGRPERIVPVITAACLMQVAVTLIVISLSG